MVGLFRKKIQSERLCVPAVFAAVGLSLIHISKQEKPYIFATLENTTPENAVECLNYLKKQYDEC